MESMRESWTDKRLDDLNAKVDTGFERIDADLRALRLETRTEFTAARAEMKTASSGWTSDALHRLMIQFCGLMFAALLGLVATRL